ncbi:MAG TPA: PKD domain-containing protein [candidate division Zixibacteria bacterium]|nr:PKD domain-containing protein [candidate division Zixibacteria bacterium]
MRHSKVSAFLAVLFFISFGMTSAQTNFYVSAECPQAVGGDVGVSTDFNIDIYIDNQLDPEEDWCGGGFSFIFYSPDESITDVTHVTVGGGLGSSNSIEYLNGYETMFNYYQGIVEFGWDDGLLPDSINFSQAGSACMSVSLPNQAYIRFNMKIDQEGIFCIDSLDYPAGYDDTWDWLFWEQYHVEFAGPYCWNITSCIGDTDCDGIPTVDDNCPLIANPGQEDYDDDDIGDICDDCTDTDNDGKGNPGFPENICEDDNCPDIYNPAQTDTDGDGRGDACDPGEVDFFVDVECGGVPLTVQFTDNSIATTTITGWFWEFGDTDGGTSTDQNPSYEYNEIGVFDVTLTISDGTSYETRTIEDIITVQDAISAGFTVSDQNVNVGVPISFTPSLGSGVGNEFYWNFGDGAGSTEKYPIHEYGVQGQFDVTLQVSLILPGCNQYDEVTYYDFITVRDLEAEFMVDEAVGIVPMTVQFTDLSPGSPTSWYWDFGDGEFSTLQNPQHTYNITGEFDVSLEVTHGIFTDEELKLDYIRVGPQEIDLEVTATGTGRFGPRAGFPYGFDFFWTNNGTYPAENCELQITIPEQLSFDVEPKTIHTGTYSGYSQAGNTYTFPLGTIEPKDFYGGCINLNGILAGNNGDILECVVCITTTSEDLNLDNNCYTYEEMLIGSWDPNDKIATPGGRAETYEIAPAERIYYTVQFENKEEATASAVYIWVVDTLDVDLDWGTLKFGEMSHPDDCAYEFDPHTGVITWFCDEIMLPPNITPPEGEGFFKYSIKPIPGLPDQTEIPNTAWIRFDYNEWLMAPEIGPIIRVIAYPYVCGDSNDDALINILDVVYMIGFLYRGGPPPLYMEAADCNNDMELDILDVVYILVYLYFDGPEPICK